MMNLAAAITAAVVVFAVATVAAAASPRSLSKAFLLDSSSPFGETKRSGLSSSHRSTSTTTRGLFSTSDSEDDVFLSTTTTTTSSTIHPQTPKTSLRTALGLGRSISNNVRQQQQRPWVVGHRGALYDELENSRAGFSKCAEMGCDAIELDVFSLPRDGSLVVFHGGGSDERPGDLTDHCLVQHGVSILDLTLQDCLQLQFNPLCTEFARTPMDKVTAARGIPTLEQVLLDMKQYHNSNFSNAKKNINIKIELKTFEAALPALLLVERLGMVDQVQFSSFHHEALQYIRTLRPQKCNENDYVYRTGALFDGGVMSYGSSSSSFLDQALTIGASEVHLRYDDCSVDTIASIREVGLTSMAWCRGPHSMTHDTIQRFDDVENEEGLALYQVLLDTGVDQICCNRPDVLLTLLQQQQTTTTGAEFMQ